eukprot:TRINITY_DN5615_c0_g1_i1.p1 TRINITY_DN5615_c0_g1~~TRINITY_DN5615_c0_g1_i1.p1  ORF type:complete len:293 (+),score=80.75 TRINITY_DN5615_c0_g1_i1:120-998(+)
MALSIYLTVRVKVTHSKEQSSPQIQISASGLGKEKISVDPLKNLIWTSALFLLEKENNHVPANLNIHLDIHNEIPLARGLGSSGAAVVCGIVLANRLLNLNLSSTKLLKYCSLLEGHPDNVGGSLRGGCVATCTTDAEVHASQVEVDKSLRAVVVIPDFEVSTEKARHALPPTYSRSDVVYNLQRVTSLALNLKDVKKGREKIAEAMKDKIHQPHRSHLIPGLSQCLDLLYSPQSKTQPPHGLIGIALSGSGSTVCALADGNFEEIGRTLSSFFPNSQFSVLSIDNTGAQVL